MYLLDTNIISYLFQKNPQVLDKVKYIPPKQLCTCSIVTSELIYGAYLNEAKSTILLSYYTEFFNNIKIFDYDLQASYSFGKIKSQLKKQGRIVEDFDIIIASIASSNKLTLVTHNTKDFENIPDLKVEDWLQIPD